MLELPHSIVARLSLAPMLLCALGLGNLTFAQPHTSDRRWTRFVPTSALVVFSNAFSAHAPPKAHLILMPANAGLAWRLGDELLHRARIGKLEPWHRAWLAYRISSSSGPHLFDQQVVVEAGPANLPQHEPVVIETSQWESRERTLDFRLWQQLVYNGSVPTEQRMRSFDASVLRLLHPEAWPSDEPLPVLLSIGAPFVYGDRATVELRDANGEIRFRTGLHDPIAFEWDPYDDTSRMPGPTMWEHGFVFLPPSHWHDPLTVGITVVDRPRDQYRFERVVRVAPEAIAARHPQPDMVRDDGLARHLFASLSPTAFIDTKGEWMAVRMGVPGPTDTREFVGTFAPHGLTVGARLIVMVDDNVVARGAFHLSPGEHEVSTFRRIIEPITLELVDGPLDLDALDRGIRLEMHADTDIAIRDFGTTRAWRGLIAWGLAPNGSPPRGGEPLQQAAFGGFIFDPDEPGAVLPKH